MTTTNELAKAKYSLKVEVNENNAKTTLNYLKFLIAEAVSYNVAAKGESPIEGTTAAKKNFSKSECYKQKDELCCKVAGVLLGHPEWKIPWSYETGVKVGNRFVSVLTIDLPEGQVSFHLTKFLVLQEFEVILGSSPKIPWNGKIGGSRKTAEAIISELLQRE